MSFNFNSENLGSFKGRSPSGNKSRNSKEGFAARIGANKPEAKERAHKFKKQAPPKVEKKDDKDDKDDD